jgi:hypothetical protein
MMEDLFKRHGGSYHLAYAHFWCEVSARMLEFRAINPSRVHVIRYEDLVDDSQSALRRAMDFLGEEMPADLVEKTFKAPPRMLPAWEGHELTRTRRIETDRVGLWKRWDPDLARAVIPVLGDTLEAWGYERPRA